MRAAQVAPILLILSATLIQPLAAHEFKVERGSGQIVVRVDEDIDTKQEAALRSWIDTAASAVSTYYGHFPVPQLLIQIRMRSGDGIDNGVTYDGRLIRIRVGTATTASTFADDWMLTHEMFHLGFPDLDDRYNWMGEGLSTYLEPIARLRVGAIPEKELWRGMILGLPSGLPVRGARGLDYSPTWGSTYWGGATFWFLADIAIRQKTANAKSLDDAIRAILAAGGDGSSHWALDDLLSKGDKATGTNVLRELHRTMGLESKAVDLDSLWKGLGVDLRRREIVYDDHAKLASIRRSIAGHR
ncbi:MAG TPA: hypothetical protein VHL58_16120 [Thermoanaerobaculia bacterium]|nr:hypothetical protein [Thermoanaerobaculia bacterium]